MIRSLVRTTLAVAVIVFAWYAASQVAANAPTAVPLVVIAVALLVCVFRALRPKAA
jgi:predicted secreted protein